MMIDIVLDEGKWLPTAMVLAAVAVGLLYARHRRRAIARRVRIQAAMNLFYGCVIGTMAGGHLLAVTIKLARGTVDGSPWFLYSLGLALAVPAWWLAMRACLAEGNERRDFLLNAWLAIALLALGLHNWPLAAPAVLNIAFHFHSRRSVGRALMIVTTAAYLALFIGALVFLASGQSFEQFMGIE